jgi:hypothetical protein
MGVHVWVTYDAPEDEVQALAVRAAIGPSLPAGLSQPAVGVHMGPPPSGWGK